MKVLVILALLFCYSVGKNMYQYGYGVNDAFWRVVWAIDEGTIWAPGFSEDKFNKVKVGMTVSEVIALLGKPLDGMDDGYWRYTKQDVGTSDFDQRWIVFDANGTVKEIRKSFFID